MRRLILMLCLSCGSAGTPAGVLAQDVLRDSLRDPLPDARPVDSGLQQPLRPVERGLTASEAARQVQRRHGGRVLAVQAEGSGYKVKVLKDGEVRIYLVNP